MNNQMGWGQVCWLYGDVPTFDKLNQTSYKCWTITPTHKCLNCPLSPYIKQTWLFKQMLLGQVSFDNLIHLVIWSINVAKLLRIHP